MAKRTKQTKKTVFEVGDFVLAKIKGYPHWPAQVTKVINSKTKPKYVVKFFRTEQIGTSFVDIKPYNASAPPPHTMKRDILEAYEECMRKYQECTKKSEEKSFGTPSPRDSPSESVAKKCEEISGTPSPGDSPSEPVAKKSEDISGTPSPRDSPREPVVKKSEDISGTPSPQDSPSEPEVKKTEETSGTPSPQDSPSEPEAKKTEETSGTPSPQDSPSEPVAKKCEKIMDASSPRVSSSEPVDCSLNDLTSEQANADRAIEKPSPNSEVIVPETNKTIEKLKKKLQEKLVEKEDKKKNLREKKEFEKASNILPKFIKKFQILTRAGEIFIANPNDKNAELQVKLSINTCECSLEQLNKCVIALSSDYGRKQKETEDFHKCLGEVVSCLTDLRKSKNQPNSRLSKICLKKMRRCKEIVRFLKSFNSHESPNEKKEQLNAERKENARKRIKLSR